jgi:hypothetical protein
MLDEMLKKKTRAMRDFSSDDILAALGLERRQSAFESAVPTTLAFVAGIAAGAGIALLLAPKSGREMRSDISNKASELTHRLSSAASEMADDVRSALPLQDSERSRSDAQRSLTGTNRSSS